MTDSHYERADNGRVLSIAAAAVMLIVAGLGLMALDTHWGDGLAQTPGTVRHNS